MSRMIQFENGFELELLIGADRRFDGIGTVRYGDTPLRSGALPWTLYAESDKGFRFDQFKLEEVQRTGDGGLILSLSSTGQWMPRRQEADAMGDARLATRRVDVPVARFRWSFHPITERIYENLWTGLTMRVEVQSPGHPIHWLIEDSTWEIGGRAEGCTLIQQDITAIPLELTARGDSAFTTAEQFKVNGVPTTPMDTLCRGAGSCVCDFQTKGELVLCLFMQPPGITRSRLEKFADEDVIHYTDRPFFPLTEKASCPERRLLVYRHPAPLARHEYRNLWLDCFTDVRRRYHHAYDFQLEVPRPIIWSHLWNDDLEVYGTAWIEPLLDALPTYARLGYQEFYPHAPWTGTSDDPTFQFQRNVCANYDYLFSEKFGGPASIKKLCDAARQLGLGVVQWVGLEFHAWSPLWKQHPDWVLRKADGDPWSARYSWAQGALWAGRIRSGFRDHLYQRLKAAQQETGLSACFWDSYGNLGQTCIDWEAPDKAPQGEDVWRFQAELQKLGFRQRCEMITVFGVGTVGMIGFEESALTKKLWGDIVAGDQAFALMDTAAGFLIDEMIHYQSQTYAPGRLDGKHYFWLAAHRCLPGIFARPWGPAWKGNKLPGGGPHMPPGMEYADEFARTNRLYNQAIPHMQRLRLSEGGRYALWLDADNRPSVLWAFADGMAPFSGSATDLSNGRETVASGASEGLEVSAGQVYRLNPARGQIRQGVRNLLCKAPSAPFRQKVPDPFAGPFAGARDRARQSAVLIGTPDAQECSRFAQHSKMKDGAR
ncbi:MAG TPA: hypothetical protein VIL86_08295 [Tepidisphaeraceae bacterium]